MNARDRLFALCVLGSQARTALAAPTVAEQKLGQLLQRGRAAPPTSAPDPTRLQERLALLAQGEAALARLDLQAAEQLFDRAALILHAADTEMALVRTYMQAGQYRRALAFGAHTAGAHLDVVGGSALYAWLLHVGGQEAIAQRLLQLALQRTPGQPLVDATVRELASRLPLASGELLQPPIRLAPYGPATGLPAAARTTGSGVLVDQGRRALVPLALLAPDARIWLRNGLGQLAAARVERRLLAAGIAVLRLVGALPVAGPLHLAARDAFPGSVALAVECVPGDGAKPRWPLLRSGFLGPPTAEGGRALGVDMPAGPRGGPVFDATGRLIGLALRDAETGDRLLTVTRLRHAIGGDFFDSATALQTPGGPPVPIDGVYEAALKTSLQVITSR